MPVAPSIHLFQGYMASFGYAKKTSSHIGETIYYHHVAEDKAAPKVIVTENGLLTEIHSIKKINEIKERVAREFNYVSAEDILLILTCGNEDMKIPAKNLLCINANNSAVKKHRISQKYEKEVADLIALLNKENLVYDANEVRLGACGNKVHSTWFVSILLLSLVYCFFRYGVNEAGVLSVDGVFGRGEVYRLVSYTFLHANIMHLVSNGTSLVYIGQKYVKRNGTLDFIIVYFFGAIASGLYSLLCRIYITGDVLSTTVGASGAIFALLGALSYNIVTDKAKSVKTSSIVICTLLIFISSSLGTGIDIMAHLAGLIAGILTQGLLDIVDYFSGLLYYKYNIGKMMNSMRKRAIRHATD